MRGWAYLCLMHGAKCCETSKYYSCPFRGHLTNMSLSHLVLLRCYHEGFGLSSKCQGIINPLGIEGECEK